MTTHAFRRIVPAIFTSAALAAIAFTAPAYASSSCVTDNLQGGCAQGADSNLAGSTQYNTYENNQYFSPFPKETSTLTAVSGGDWKDIVNTGPDSLPGDTNYGMVTGYPDTQLNWSADLSDDGNVPLSDFTMILGRYTETMPDNADTMAESAYDIWSNYADDIMIWTQNVNRPLPETGASELDSKITVNGMSYSVWRYGGTGGEIVLSQDTQAASGEEHILDLLRAIQGKWGLPKALAIGEINYGFEICSTHDKSETFSVSRLDLYTTGKGLPW